MSVQCSGTSELNLLSVAVGEEHVPLGGGEPLQLLRRHHVAAQPRQLGLHLPLALHGLAVLLQVELQRLHVVVEAEGGHREQDVLAVDGLSFLCLTPLAGLTDNIMSLI